MADEIPQRQQDLLALALVPGMGPRLTAALLERFGSAGEVRRAGANELQSVPHIGGKISEAFVASLRAVDVDKEIQLLKKHAVELIAIDDPDYPKMLKQIHGAPQLLFLRGKLEPNDEKAIAIVGSRRHTGYGRRITERLAAEFARAGYTVVSGLARGIDGFAHRAALDAGGRTIAVLAGGLSRIYPPEHKSLADDVGRNGALITETPMQVDPQPGMFPARNRLISGLCRGVIIVEANEKSGALITARHALEQNREVFAVPGAVDSPESAGCLQLIRDGAKLIRSADDVVEDLDGVRSDSTKQRVVEKPTPQLAPDQQRVWEFLAEKPRFADELAQQLNMPIPQLTGLLMQMELNRIVRRLPGNQYERA